MGQLIYPVQTGLAGCLACATLLIAGHAQAQTELTFGLGVDGYTAKGHANTRDTFLVLYPELTLTTTADSGWSVEMYLAPEFYLSSSDTKIFGADDPYTVSALTVTTPSGLSFGVEYENSYLRDTEEFVRESYEIFIGTESFGQLSYGDFESAVGYRCMTAPGGTTNFVADELRSFGSCESLGFQSTLLYSSPLFGRGYTVYASLSNPSDADLIEGDPSRIFGLALSYGGDFGGNSLDYTIGFERATDFLGTPDHGGAHVTVLQAGAVYVVGDLTYSASGSAQIYEGTDATQYGLAIGIDWQATDRLLIAGGASHSRTADFTTPGFPSEHQTTYGLAAEYAVIPNRLTLDIGASHLSAPSGDQTLIGVGFSVSIGRSSGQRDRSGSSR